MSGKKKIELAPLGFAAVFVMLLFTGDLAKLAKQWSIGRTEPADTVGVSAEPASDKPRAASADISQPANPPVPDDGGLQGGLNDPGAKADLSASADNFMDPAYLKFRPGAESPRVQEAMRLDGAKNYKSAFEIFSEEAKNGNPHAQFMMAKYFDHGIGRPINVLEALKWYRLAASNGHIVAHYNLGVMFQTGDGVPDNYRDAMKHYTVAAEACYLNAQNNLGILYARLPKKIRDYAQAHMWLEIAIALGDKKAKEVNDLLRHKVTIYTEYEAGVRKAQEWLESHSCE
ncbi:tetratricopeptide repeat protein [Thalassospiraceae bacterium LMO-JJ14]|nr:tetratricopeptide repeat protein [Thalassospiraceae bacterium LMO-JJ14]